MYPGRWRERREGSIGRSEETEYEFDDAEDDEAIDTAIVM